MNMKKKVLFSICIIIFACLFAGCSKSDRKLKMLASIDSVMEQNPQAAYNSLCQFKRKITKDEKREVTMRYHLMMAKVQNKLCLQMPSDSSFKEVVSYYNDRGDSNQKMLVNYLMGCIYRDQKEAPMAMQYYQQAIEYADTSNKICDYKTLFCIYGQMAYVYRCQSLHKKAIEAFKKYSHFALLANDKDSYACGFSYQASEYYEMGDTMKAVALIVKANKLCKKYGMYQRAAQVIPFLIYFHLNRKQYEKAHLYMQYFEKSSGFFDDKQRIVRGQEHYYKAKGWYYRGIQQYDSAEYYYRKLGSYGFHYEAAQGLLCVFQSLNKNDSAMKYSVLCEKEMDKILNSNQAKAVVVASSLYDYSKLQKEIDEEKLRDQRNKFVMILIGVLMVLGLAYSYQRYKKMKQQMKQKMEQRKTEYLKLKGKLEKTQGDFNQLQSNVNFADHKKSLMTNEIVHEFLLMSSANKAYKLPKVSDWESLSAVFQQYLPTLIEKMRTAKLSTQEFHVCMLVFLGLGGLEIARLVNTSTKVVSNAKQKVNYKLFKDNRASSLYDNLVNLLM